MASYTYSFLDCQAAIKDDAGSFSLGNGAGAAEEGISISYVDDKGSLMTGADGQGMHSLHAGKAGTVTVRVLKTSPVNAQLSDLYNATTQSGAAYGRSTISVRDPVRGDDIVCSGCGIRKHPDLAFAKDGGMQEWVWNAAQVDVKLGTGQPSAVI